MKLEFSLLVVDNEPDTVDEAIGSLSDYLGSKGFMLKKTVALDLSESALRTLARSAGRDFNLVMVDYNLGRDDTNGAVAAAKLRRELSFTDMVFYSSSPSVNLLSELAKQQVAGVFVADRGSLGETLVGLAETVIGKAIDLNHMRGIAMAEVSNMDVQMEETLQQAFGVGDECISRKATRTMKQLVKSSEELQQEIADLAGEGKILELVMDPRLFSSMHKYRALIRVADCLPKKPQAALDVLGTYVSDVINNRNTLAHAKEDLAADGTSSLRAISKGKPSIPIDDDWMVDFRGKLHAQRAALATVCEAIAAHINGLSASQKGK